MTLPAADTLNLIPTVHDLEMAIFRGGGWSLALNVLDPVTGVGLDLTGKTAVIHLPGNINWTATITGSQFRWDLPKSSVDALVFQVGDAYLTVADGTNTTVWATGKVRVI